MQLGQAIFDLFILDFLLLNGRMGKGVNMKRAILVLFALFLAGCATSRNAEMKARLDSYVADGMTYEQAVVEYGPPTKETTTDNFIVAEWTWDRGRRGGGMIMPMGTGYMMAGRSRQRTETMRLIFDRESKKLKSYYWESDRGHRSTP